MNKPDVKKLVLLNLPYIFAFYFADKIAAVFRLAPGTEFIDKLTNGFAVFGTAFANPLPSFHPVDLLIGLIAGALLKLAVYVKGKNRKKLRQGEEYGSARWGKPEDIKPYMDPEFSNNVILTQTEFLTMNSRPKQPKYARNKNILVIGGSGSGKTRFFVKPNLMQMHSSYVVTDPKGTVLVECGKMLEKGGYVIKSLNTINFRKSMNAMGATLRWMSRDASPMRAMSVSQARGGTGSLTGSLMIFPMNTGSPAQGKSPSVTAPSPFSLLSRERSLM